MGTYVDCMFGHSGDAEEIATLLRELVNLEGWELAIDGRGRAEATAECLRTRWAVQGLWNRVHLDSERMMLHVYARGATVYHSDVRYWAFASDGLMDSGVGRKEVRARTQALARRFRADRILYVSDRTGVNRLTGGLSIDEEEKYLHSGSPPAAWDHQVTDAATYMGFWFRDRVAP